MTHIEPWDRPNYCTAGASAGPKTIMVQQVLGEREVQKSLDIHVVVPRHKPAIEQIVDVFVKRLCITSVDVIPNKVIVRGQFEVKALYVACRPRHPVHAVEVWPIRFTAYADIRGVRRGTDADASVMVEFVDYDCDEHTRAYWHKKKSHDHDWHDDYDDCDDDWDYDDCDDDDCDDCDCHDECHHKHKPHKKHKCKPDCDDDCDCDHDYHHCKPHRPRRRTRRFDVSVVLRITVKAMTEREVTLYQGYPGGLPAKPKG
ncbi:DUF3794 domain-containing protein [Sporomusa aerivorans]|uniref:DUF3794 domain-containing protein n=1 Tax=Sporomusa aerivorans TaxID=204936 RepID=UPI00352A74EE